jgi:hypothetical protein
MLTNDRRYTPNKIIDFMFEIFKRLKNTIINRERVVGLIIRLYPRAAITDW